jgi:hypothetical protein
LAITPAGEEGAICDVIVWPNVLDPTLDEVVISLLTLEEIAAQNPCTAAIASTNYSRHLSSCCNAA